jgi:hypothetical protein
MFDKKKNEKLGKGYTELKTVGHGSISTTSQGKSISNNSELKSKSLLKLDPIKSSDAFINLSFLRLNVIMFSVIEFGIKNSFIIFLNFARSLIIFTILGNT